MLNEIQMMCRQHDALRDVVTQYMAALGKTDPDIPALALCRWRLTRLVSAHLAFEDRHFYPALERGDAHAAGIGQRMAAESGHLFESFQDHVRIWTSDAIADDWSGYRKVASALLLALRTRMDREETELYPLMAIARAA